MANSTERLAKTLNHFLSRDFTTKAELSRKAGISRANLDLYLKGKSSPTLDTLDQIASAIEMTPAQIFQEPGPIIQPHSLQDCLDTVTKAALSKSSDDDELIREAVSLLSALDKTERRGFVTRLQLAVQTSTTIREKKAK